ncbi:MAG TPA: hypothetical protein VFW11_24185 [Cyclobacteriaceae bacterium]|nr:hypothetical protein [Cyclobacteriaceae bacterium]
MKIIRFLALGLSFSLCSISMRAQQIHVGLTTAVNATFVLDKGLSEDPRYNSTYTYNVAPIGFNFGVDFTREIRVITGINLVKAGSDISNS